MVLNRHILSLMLGVSVSFWAIPAAAKPLTQAEFQVCQSLKHCLDIVDRHKADEYDYSVLSQEFQRFGHKGRKLLLGQLSSKRRDDALKAQTLLQAQAVSFSPDDRGRITQLWSTGRFPDLTPLMKTLYSPDIRRAVISTLSHENITIRGLSRDILNYGEAALTSRPLIDSRLLFRPPQNNETYLALVKAALDYPTAEIIAFLSTYPPAKTRIIFDRLLHSDDAAIVSLAYETLHKESPTFAAQSLSNRIKVLTKEDAANALALLTLLSQIDETSSLSKTLPPSVKRDIESVYRTQLNNMWQYLKANTNIPRQGFVRQIRRFPFTADIDSILSEALQDPLDYRVTVSAIKSLGVYENKRAIPTIKNLSKSHPVREVRLAAFEALDRIEEQPQKIARHIQTLEKQMKYCGFALTDFKSQSRALPHFDAYRFADSTPLLRFDLNSAVPTAKGWLAGYSPKNDTGGLIYFDNKKGRSDLLLRESVTLVIPKKTAPLGQSNKDFWVFSQGDKTKEKTMGHASHLYSVADSEKGFAINLQAVLPGHINGATVLRDKSVLLDFEADETSLFQNADHPPLRLFPNGRLMLACKSSQKS